MAQTPSRSNAAASTKQVAEGRKRLSLQASSSALKQHFHEKIGPASDTMRIIITCNSAPHK